MQYLKIDDEILISQKPTGTLVTDYMLPGKHLYLVGTGTGLAPFLSIVKDHEIYEQFDKIILIHGVRYISELAYRDTIQEQLPKHEYLGDLISQKLIYYPLVTREPHTYNGRVTEAMTSGKLFLDTKCLCPIPKMTALCFAAAPAC